MSSPRYQAIADDLRARVERGEFSAGRVLPSEAELSGAYEVSRVTVRRALDQLREEGLVSSRQGFGWLVAADPLRQSLGRLGTIESQLAEAGIRSERRILDFAYVPATGRVEELLGDGTVLRVRRLNLADEEPFAVVTVWCPEDLAGELSRSDVERRPFYDLLGMELGGATQTIGAGVAGPRESGLLHIPVGSPTLDCERVTTDVDGRVVLVSNFVFPGHRTEFVVELPRAEESIAPSGLRLVE